MIYSYKCPKCGSTGEFVRSLSEGPLTYVTCLVKVRGRACETLMHRDWQADAPMIDTSACRDHSEIPAEKRVRSAWDGNRSPECVEAQFSRQIEGRRKEIREAGGQQGTLKQTHAVPTHLYHGKIKETGDKNYWSDPKNLNRHTECKVE
jgi:hypothetical protein